MDKTFGTSDLYLGAYLKTYCSDMISKRAGDKIIFTFTFNEESDPESLQAKFYEDYKLQEFITSVKEIRNTIYKQMRKA